MNQPWPEIVAWYRDNENVSESVRGIGGLSSHIASSQLAKALFGWTSMFDLLITQTPVTYPYEGPMLRVSPQAHGLIEFRYIDTPVREEQWARIERPERAIARLHSFLRQLHWVADELLEE